MKNASAGSQEAPKNTLCQCDVTVKLVMQHPVTDYVVPFPSFLKLLHVALLRHPFSKLLENLRRYCKLLDEHLVTFRLEQEF